ncbi:SH3 domain-containing protein, partial [Citrobacter freundii]|uniref:SH3 domain-containing protein n=1 Tax=Citrobacter freundii TaxID=546 RepID=UPI001BA8DE16
IQQQAGLADSWNEQIKAIQKQAGFASTFHEQMKVIQQQAGLADSWNEQIKAIQKQAGFASTFHEQMKAIQQQAGLADSWNEQIKAIQKQAGFSSTFHEQMKAIQQQAGLAGSWNEQIKAIQKQAGFASTLHEQMKELYEKANSGHMVRKQFDGIQKQIDLSSLVLKQFNENQELLGLYSAGTLLKDFQKQAGLFNSVNPLIKNESALSDYFKNNHSSLTSIVELGLSSVAKAYTAGFLKTTDLSISKPDDISKSLSDNSDYSTFINLFKTLPQPVQTVIYIILTQIIFGAFIDYGKSKVLIGINKIETYVESLFENKPITRTEILGVNKDIDWTSLNDFRIITGENIRLRTKPSMKSEVVEVIGKNTVVAILDKKDRQWLYVQVKSGDELITGWITRTYTKPIKG